MAKTENNKMYGTGDSVVQNTSGGIPVGAKITRIGPNDMGTVVDAFNIDWASGQYSYDGNPEHIIQSTGHLIEIIKSGAGGGTVWDDIVNTVYVTSQVSIYTTSNSKDKPDVIWPNAMDPNPNYDNVLCYSDLPNYWYSSIDEAEGGQHVFMSSVYKVMSLENETLAYHGPHTAVIYLPGENGLNGNFKSTVFTRTNVTPNAPETGAYYDTGLPSNTSVSYTENSTDYILNGITWHDGIPSGQNKLWASTSIIKDINGNFDSTATWSEPKQMTDTSVYDVEFALQEEKPDAPNVHNQNGGDEEQVWFDPTKDPDADWEHMNWRAERECLNGEWTDWIIVRIKGEKGETTQPAPYFEQRWRTATVSEQVDAPQNGSITLNRDDNTVWKLTPQYAVGQNTWITSHKVIYELSAGSWEPLYDPNSNWSTPIRINGLDGQSQPIKPVLKYQWHDSYDSAPSCNTTGINPGNNWTESPGNPVGSNRFLWMIQGERQNNEMNQWDANGDGTANEYWSNPVCLSGQDGEPGKDGDDIEFVYKRYESAHIFDETDNPRLWYNSADITKPATEWTGSGNNNQYAYVNDYLGGISYGWYDNPRGVDSTYKYEYATYRKTHKINGESYWEGFSTPFSWSIFGENGLDGDGVEYIYYAQQNATPVPKPPKFDLSTESFQKPEVFTYIHNGETLYTWHDDPQTINNDNQRYQYVSTRKYREVTANNIGKLGAFGSEVNIGDKIWFPYSSPELWNWYINDGTQGDKYVMIYTWDYKNSTPTNPNTSINDWTESPGNASGEKKYLWMSGKYAASTAVFPYTNSNEWSDPVCLTGADGVAGKDGTDIEFIYLRTDEDNATLILPATNSSFQENDWPFNESNCLTTNDGIKFVNGTYINGVSATNYPNHASDELVHNVWTDNPLGVTHSYDYEYATIRKKIQQGSDMVWQSFCKPFLWSKYGEDGIDGDGVEYIFFRSNEQNQINWGDSPNPLNIKDPRNWDSNSTADGNGHLFTDDDYIGPINSGWTDDPLGVDNNNRWEYVSIRRQNDGVWQSFSKPALWSHFAVDGLAVNLTLESDNDMMAVSIDDDDVVTAAVSSQATFGMYYNTRLVNTSYYNMSIITSNINNENSIIGTDVDTNNNTYSYLRTTINSNIHTIATLKNVDGSYVLSTNVPEGFDMTDIDNELRITSIAHIINNSFDDSGNIEIGTERPFVNKVNGLHLSLSDIYQIQLDKNVVKKDPNGNLQTITVSLKSLTTLEDRIEDNTAAINKNLYVYYDGYNLGNGNYGWHTVPVGSAITLQDATDKIEHKFELWYEENHNSNGTTKTGTKLDVEIATRVFDGINGNPGTDSKTDEYIYFVSDDISYFENGNHSSLNPYNWNNHEKVIISGVTYYAYNTDDFPFVSGRTTYLGWEDNQIGISKEMPYQFTSSRSYNTSTKEWSKFSNPVCTHNWGHSGEDGDGVEYIYLRNSSFTSNEPNFYSDDSEYYESPWTDDPTGIEESNPKEYVSVRKYKKLSYVDIRDYLDNYTNVNGSGIITSNDIITNQTSYNNVLSFINGSSNTYKAKDVLYNVKDSLTTGTKHWSPYSYPSLWAKYGDKGPIGGSGLTIDITNPVMQVAVNSNRLIKDFQGNLSTYIDIYNGKQKLSTSNYSISLPSAVINDTAYAPFNISKKSVKIGDNTITYGYTISGNKYTWTFTGDADTNDNGLADDTFFQNNLSLWDVPETGIQLPFVISYDGTNYTKYLNIIGINNGKDGDDAEFYELDCSYSTIHYNRMLDTPGYEPNSIEYKIRHIKGNQTNELLQFKNNSSIDGGSLAVSYAAGNSSTWTVFGNNSKNAILNINNLSLEDDETLIKIKLEYTDSGNTKHTWDEDSLEIVFDGINGVDGNSIEYIYYRPSGSTEQSWTPWTTGTSNDNNSLNPSYWAPNNSPDYRPSSQQSNWTDHPQGVDSEHQYEYISVREYDGSTKTWGRYSSPAPWSHYGETGKDGDGIEYIYRVYSTKPSFSNNSDNPASYLWFTNSDYQTAFEYVYNSNWHDEPQNVNNSNKYQYVSVRKYRELNSTSYNDIKNLNYIKNYVTFVDNELKRVSGDNQHIAYSGEKIWFPYSTPKVWSSYGDVGPQGPGGSDAFILDWDNDQINLAVNNLGYVLSSQSKTSTLSIYNNSNIKMWNDSTHQITYSSDFDVNKMTLTNDNNRINLSYSVKNNSELEAKIITRTISNHNDYTYIPEGGIEITFDIPIETKPGTYTTASKVLKICGQHTAVDGTQGPATVTYELVPNFNSIVYDSNFNLVFPESLSYTVFKYSADTITSLGASSFGNTIAYVSYLYGPSTTEHPTSKTTCKAPITIPNDYASTYSYINLILNKKVGSTWREIDKENVPILKNGVNGEPGAGTFIVEFSNDQVNFSVNASHFINTDSTSIGTNEDNVILYGQKKVNSTKLYLISENPNMEFVAVTNLYSDDSYYIYLVDDISQLGIDADNDHDFNVCVVASVDSNDKKYINVSEISILNDSKIPDEGFTIYLEVQVKNTVTNNVYTTYKSFKICGQYIPQNGNNAVTYEIIPSANSVTYTVGGAVVPTSISHKILKYDGNTISEISTSGTQLSVQSYFGNASSSTSFNGTISTTNAGKYSYIQFNLLYNSTLIDAETVPIVKSGQPGPKGDDGKQGFTGAIVRYRGIYDHTKEYYNGIIKGGIDDQYIPTLYYKDIVSYQYNSGTKYYTPSITYYNKWHTQNASQGSTYTYYISGVYPATPSGGVDGNWVEASQYEFVATRLLYADQALINQISSHDFIATNSNGYPVAGITTGYLGNATSSYSHLNKNNNTTGQTIDLGEGDGADVRIFAGQIKKGSKYSLTYAPFNVRQDGTAYMSNAIVSGDITANTLGLGSIISTSSNYSNINDTSRHCTKEQASDFATYKQLYCLGSFAIWDEAFTGNQQIWSNYTNYTIHRHVRLPELKEGETKTFYLLSTDGKYGIYTASTGHYHYIYVTVSHSLESGQDYYIAAENNGSHEWKTGKDIYGYSDWNVYFIPAPYKMYQFIGINKQWYVIETPLSITSAEPEYKLVDVSNDVTLLGWSIDANNYSRWMDSEEYYTEHETTSDYDMGWGPRVRYVDNNTNVFEFYTYLNVDNDTDITGAMCNFGSLYWFNTGSISNN